MFLALPSRSQHFFFLLPSSFLAIILIFDIHLFSIYLYPASSVISVNLGCPSSLTIGCHFSTKKIRFTGPLWQVDIVSLSTQGVAVATNKGRSFRQLFQSFQSFWMQYHFLLGIFHDYQIHSVFKDGFLSFAFCDLQFLPHRATSHIVELCFNGRVIFCVETKQLFPGIDGVF